MVRVGIHPINWSNDDFHDLGGDTTFETCLAQMKEAGYQGTERGHKFPTDPDTLLRVLRESDLELASAWHSTYLLTHPKEAIAEEFDRDLHFLKRMRSSVIIVAECSGAIYPDPKAAVFQKGPSLTDPEWSYLCQELENLAARAAGENMRVAYHPHLGTRIQTEDDVYRLLRSTTKLGLVLDTGHLTAAGARFEKILKDFGSRVFHIHAKSVRTPVLQRAKDNGYSFHRAVREGLFAVPGDGNVNFNPVFDWIEKSSYSGWVVVEAEQDPHKADPFQHAVNARKFLRKHGL